MLKTNNLFEFLILNFSHSIRLIFLKHKKLPSHKTNSLLKYFVLKNIFQVRNFKFFVLAGLLAEMPVIVEFCQCLGPVERGTVFKLLRTST